jgi:serine/threonine protein kinase
MPDYRPDYRGQRFGNYQLIDLLGEGGYAQVYLGEQVFLKTKAAIKVLHTRLDDEKIEQFRFEANTIAHLDHPHIVRLLDFGVEHAAPYLIMDYAPNGTLHQLHPPGVPVPLALVVSYVQQIADALDYAHQQKIIHRDIKPENLLVGRRGEVLLSDFGIAVVAHQTTSLTTQQGLGTISYVAPEQLWGKPRPASDQYALAAVVYEWLTGRTPFQGSPMEVAIQHLEAPPPPMHVWGIPFPAEVEQVVRRALEKQWPMRYNSAREFADALHDASLARPAVVRGPAEDVPLPLPEQMNTPDQAQETEQPIPSSMPEYARAVPAAIADQKTVMLEKPEGESAPDDPTGERITDPDTSVPGRPPGARRFGRRRLGLLALIALLLLAALGAGSLLSLQGMMPGAAHVEAGLSSSQAQGTQTPGTRPNATSSPGASAIPTARTTPSPASASPTATPSSAASPTSTTTPNLSVSPGSLTFSLQILNCTLNNQPKKLTLQNTGGGNLTWNATIQDPTALSIDISSGTLAPSQTQPIQVTASCQISVSKTVTITFSSNGGQRTVPVTIILS